MALSSTNLWTIARGAKRCVNSSGGSLFYVRRALSLSALGVLLSVPVFSVVGPQTYSFLSSSLSWEFLAHGRFYSVRWGREALPPPSPSFFVPLFRSLLPVVARLRKLLKRYLTTPIQH